MKNFYTLSILLFLTSAIHSQDITVSLSKNKGQITYSVTGAAKDSDDKYEIANNSSFKITLVKNRTIDKYDLTIKNQSGDIAKLLDVTGIKDDSKEIRVREDGTIEGGSADKKLAASFSVNINDVRVIFKTSPVQIASIQPSVKSGLSYKPTGIAFFDAKTLADVIHHTTAADTIFSVLSYYTTTKISKTNFEDYAAAENFYKNNLFMMDYIEEAKKTNAYRGAQSGILSKNMFSSAVSSVGGLNVTNFADGLAKFLVSRFKEELSEAFFEKFKKDLNKAEYADLRILFPETYKTFNTVDKDIYNFSAYMNTLREVFIKDLTNGYLNLQTVLNQQKYKDYFQNKRPELGTMLYTSLYFTNQLSSGVHPGEVFAKYDLKTISLGHYDDPKIQAAQNNIQNSIHTVQIISGSLHSLSKNNYWVSADSVRMLFEDTTALKIYLGLIYQQVDGIAFTNGSTNSSIKLQDILKKMAESHMQDSLYQYKYFIESFADNAQEINENILSLKERKKSEIDYNDYYKLFNSSLNLLQFTSTFTGLPYMNTMIGSEALNKIKDHTNSILSVAHAAGELYIDVRTKNYSSGIINTISILDTLLQGDIIIAENRKAARTALFRYGSFMASVAQAENSDDVEKAIESVALPAGSSRIKKETAWSLSLNAYCGLYVGHAQENVFTSFENTHVVNTYGVAAPVGIALNKGLKDGWSASLFVSVIDIGAIASFRINNDTTKALSKIELKDIISPGTFLSIGFPKIPVSFNIGCQLAPFLDEVSSSGNRFQPSYFRWSAGVCVDIPVFNLWSKPKE